MSARTDARHAIAAAVRHRDAGLPEAAALALGEAVALALVSLANTGRELVTGLDRIHDALTALRADLRERAS